MQVQTQRIDFPNARGELLSARLELPVDEPRAFAIFAHCFTCSKDVAAATRISRALCERGIAVLRFDFTGLGNSEGDFANTNFSSNVDDLVAAAEFLREQHQPARLLIGHSLGGAAVLAAGGRLAEVRAVVTIGAPSEPQHVLHLLEADLESIEREGQADVTLAGRKFRIQKQFVEDVEESRLRETIRALGKPLLILHSPQDDIVGIDQARRIYEAAVHPKSFVSLDGADHLLSRREDSEYVAATIAAWASRYLPMREAPAARSEEGFVRVEETGSGFANRISTSRHTLRADEPVSVGGTDTGPTPYELLLASLGACTSMTLRMYAQHKGIELERIAVRLKHAKIHAADCESCESTEGRVDRIERELELTGDLTEEQRQRMLEIADRCPVHRTLVGEKEIVTRLAEAGAKS